VIFIWLKITKEFRELLSFTRHFFHKIKGEAFWIIILREEDLSLGRYEYSAYGQKDL